MALADLYDTVIARAARVVRRNAIMPRLCDMEVSAEAVGKFGTVDFPIIGEATTSSITPAAVPPGGGDPAPTTVPLTLSNWKKSSFTLTDRDIDSMANSADFVPKQLEAHASALADDVDGTILALYKGVYGYAGTAGTTPFATSTVEAQAAVRVLSSQKCPQGNRAIVLDPFAHANAIGLDVLQRVDASGSQITLREAQIGYALGLSWAEDQNVPTHTTGAAGTILIDNGAGYAAGVTAIHIDGATTVPSVGDVFTIAGNTQTYTVLTASALVGTDSDLTIRPGLAAAVADNAAITFKASHTANMVFRSDAIAYASRPVAETMMPELQVIRTFVDDVSGVVMSLEIKREYYQYSFYLSAMWGAALLYPQKAVRLAG